MSTIYTKQELMQKINNAKNNMEKFYDQGFINWRGKIKGGKEYYTEIVAGWLIENIDLLESIKTITRKETYKTASHNGKIANPNSTSKEKILAKMLFNLKNFDFIGEIIDYQTPLKDKQIDEAGEIDLLAYNKDEKILRILELKRKDSEETMLRCVLEGYTYLKIVDEKKLLKDFGLPEDTAVVASPFVFYNGKQHKEMSSERKKLEELMKILNIVPFYIKEENGNYEVVK